jgi:TolA-binding protein
MCDVKFKNIAMVLAAAFASVAAADQAAGDMAGGVTMPHSGLRYATDAYPGFDNESNIINPSRKTPRWFSFITGPSCSSAAEQWEHCNKLVQGGSFYRAARQLDALVREWPTSPEAPKAQRLLGEVYLNNLKQTENAFEEFKYLIDFYSMQCGYAATANELYKIANLMLAEGKEIMFIRFENTVDVRRAYEACVLRAPGAKWVPEAMLTIGALRVKEGKLAEAVSVYENLRNIYPQSPEAKVSFLREAEVRMQLLDDHAYNRERCRDTIDYLKMALVSCRESDAEILRSYLTDAEKRGEAEAWKATLFYDSPTRTKRSAAGAYEKYLKEYPDGCHSEEAKTRLAELKEASSK